MKVLIDTHVFLWWLFDDPKLCKTARNVIAAPANTILLSSASAWEIATKHRIGKLPEAKEIIANFQILLDKARFQTLSITLEHSLKAGSLNIQHKDPFDRMLIAQAEIENLPIITYDKAFFLDFLTIIPGP
jgi:PIN domain nuclease of toxin-antitoxin system